MSFGIRVQRDGLRADPDAEVDLGAGWGDDLASADDPRAVRLRAGGVGRVRVGLSNGERRSAQPRRQQIGERTQAFDLRLLLFFSKAISEELSGHGRPPWIFSVAQRDRPCENRGEILAPPYTS